MGSALHVDPVVNTIPALRMGSNAVLTGEGILRVNELTIYGGRIEGYDTVLVTTTYDLHADSNSFTTSAEIRSVGLNKLTLSGPGIFEENGIWVADLGHFWRGEQEGVRAIAFDLTAHSSVGSLSYRIETDGAVILTPEPISGRHVLADGMTRNDLVATISSERVVGAFAQRISFLPDLDGAEDVILELRGHALEPVPLMFENIWFNFDWVRLDEGSLNYTFGPTVTQWNGESGRARISAGGDYGRYHVPSQQIALAPNVPVEIAIHLSVDSASLQATGYLNAWADIPIEIEMLPPNGVQLEPLKRTEFVHVGAKAYLPGLPAEVHLEARHDSARFFYQPGLHYQIERSSDLLNWEVVREHTPDEPGFATIDYEPLQNDEDRLFLRVRVLEE